MYRYLTSILIVCGLCGGLAFGTAARASSQPVYVDSDADGLEDSLEAKLETDPARADTDGDGLSDYDEYCKYRTDPTKKDTDGDGTPDGDWQERREYAYTIRALCEMRPPNDAALMNDLYQDVRPAGRKARLADGTVVEILLFPFSTPHVFAQPYPRTQTPDSLRKYVEPDLSMNFSEEMQKEIKEKIVAEAKTDVEAIEKILTWMAHETRLANDLPEFAYFNVVDNKIVWRQSLGSPEKDQKFLQTNFFGDAMFKSRLHGTCTSTATLRATMLRAAGLPTRLIQNLPLITRYEGDPEPLVEALRMRVMSKGYDWGPAGGGANHCYNEVFLNNHWIRVDNVINPGPFVGSRLFVKVYSLASWNNRADWRTPRPPEEGWNENRSFRTLEVSDAYPKYTSPSATTIDMAVTNESLAVTANPDGSFTATITIRNKGSMPTPEFEVRFCAGDPQAGGRLLARHGSGPILPGGTWGEYDPHLRLTPDEDTIVVVIDPENRVKESDESNNKATRVIPGRKAAPSGPARAESAKVDIAIGDKDLIVTKLSDRVFEASILIRNNSSVPLPRFRVNFYAGDPDKGGRLLSPQQAGPIMPGDGWKEYNPALELRPGENVISVIVDPDNRVEESDETNNKASRSLSEMVSESEQVVRVGAVQKLDLSSDDILQIEAQASKGFHFPYYLFIPGGIAKDRPAYVLVETNNSGMVSDDWEVHRAKALTFVKTSHANRMARRLGVPLLVPTFPRPRPETHKWAYTHALDIDTLEIEEGELQRIDLQLTAMIKHAQELLRTNGFQLNEKVFLHGFSASAKFCNRCCYLHPEMVKAAAAGGVNGLPTLPVREWNGYELPFPIGLAGIERFTGKPFDEKAFRQVAQYIYLGSADTNDTLLSREAWREEEAALIRKALAAEKMMPDRWEVSRDIYRQQQLPAQLVTYDGVGHSIQSQMLDDVIKFFQANAGEKYVPIEPSAVRQ